MIDKLKTSPHVKRATEFVGSGTNKLRERLINQQYIDKKKKELKEKMNMPPFVRTIDKLYVARCSFALSLSLQTALASVETFATWSTNRGGVCACVYAAAS
jgi:hypothetical protein